MTALRVLDLFSGIGGFSLGLERTGGFRTAAFCEIDPFCRRVLSKHWPEVPCYHDVRELTADRLSADGIGINVICGGFPCQDISSAGKGAGLKGERSGLWSEIARLSSELRPRYVIVENVAALLFRGFDKVLGDLAALGYDAEWHCIPASAVGASHRRDRVWIVAYPNGERELQSQGSVGDVRGWSSDGGEAVVHPNGAGLHDRRQAGQQTEQSKIVWGRALAESNRRSGPWWAAEPDVGRVANGVPKRVDRLRALGNAVVPQIPEMIGRAILAAAR
jgi:DNA (cytosine-5)-methyltransferase 1